MEINRGVPDVTFRCGSTTPVRDLQAACHHAPNAGDSVSSRLDGVGMSSHRLDRAQQRPIDDDATGLIEPQRRSALVGKPDRDSTDGIGEAGQLKISVPTNR